MGCWVSCQTSVLVVMVNQFYVHPTAPSSGQLPVLQATYSHTGLATIAKLFTLPSSGVMAALQEAAAYDVQSNKPGAQVFMRL